MFEIMLTEHLVQTEEALTIGLVMQLADTGDLMSETLKIASAISASNPSPVARPNS